MIARAIAAHPEQLYVVRIDNWFGDRWAGFAGKILGAAGVHHHDNPTLPPFVPSRVVRQDCFRFSPDEQRWVRDESAEALHIEQPSEANFRRRVDEMLPTSALVWFSDNSATSRRGSVMAYVPSEAGHDAWYADLAANGMWSPKRLIGLTRAELTLH